MTTRRDDLGTGTPDDPIDLHKTQPGSTDLASGAGVIAVPDLTYTVSIPATVHEVPEHEVAISIADIPIMPVYVDASAPITTSIPVITELSLTVPQQTEFGPVIPALPESDDVRIRRPRPRKAKAPVAVLPELVGRKGRKRRPAPEGALRKALYTGTFRLVNVGDSWAVRQRKALDGRIARSFDSTRFVPVLSRKGGVGTTTVAALTAMAFAEVRDDHVLAIDANPDRGTLADRVTRTTRSTVRDVVRRSRLIKDRGDFEALVTRDETGLDVLASDPTQVVPLGAHDYNTVADLAAQHYSLAILDEGTGLVHSATRAALQRADAVVIVSGGSVDEARSASETITWLEANGYPELAANAIIALNTATLGTNLDKIAEIEAHFDSRVRDIVRIPYDPMLATGSVIHYASLKPFTRDAARDLAALVADGLPGIVEPASEPASAEAGSAASGGPGTLALAADA